MLLWHTVFLLLISSVIFIKLEKIKKIVDGYENISYIKSEDVDMKTNQII